MIQLERKRKEISLGGDTTIWSYELYSITRVIIFAFQSYQIFMCLKDLWKLC